MAIRVVRLGTPRSRGEGLRLGTVRLLPRGVRKENYARQNFFDVWLPEVAPSRELVAYAQAEPWTDARWAAYEKRYLREMARPEAQRVIQRMLTAAQHFNYQLPEVFAGMRRSETPFPIAYPTAARPQAWAAGAPVLLLQALLGLQPDRRRHALDTVAPPELPSWAGTIRLSGIRAFGTLWDARLEDGTVRVDAA